MKTEDWTKTEPGGLMIQEEERAFFEWTRQQTLPFQRLMTYYRCALRELETKFEVLDEEFSLLNDRNPISVIKTRLKSPASIIDKLSRNHWPLSVASIEDKLDDVAGIRVVCSFVEDVYKLVEALLKQDDITLLEKKDYIEKPKANGYRSLHLIVEVPIFLEKEKRPMKVEVQLRTIAMDSWATLEHQLRYKKERELTPEMEAALFHCAQLSQDLDQTMDGLRASLNL